MGIACSSFVKKQDEGGRDSRATFLDGLPSEVLDNVLRHLSTCPRSQNWQNHVDISDALALYTGEGALTNLARRHFRALCAVEGEVRDGALIADVSTRRDTRRFLKLLEAAGETLEEIQFEAQHRATAFCNTFARHCTNVRRLELSSIPARFPLRKVLKARAGQLDALHIESYDLIGAQVDAIAKYCTGLKKLGLECDAAWDALTPVWRTVGPTLTELSLSASYTDEWDDSKIWKDALGDIKEHCVRLHTISFRHFPDDVQDNIAYLCTSYGAQLENLRFRQCTISFNIFTDIVRACPNVMVDTQAESAGLVGTLEALGTHVQTLSYYGDDQEPLDFDLARAAEGCPNIKTIIVECMDVTTAEFLTAMLKAPKLFLETVEISENFDSPAHRFRITKDILKTLAENATGIKHFTLSCELMPPGTFDDFAKANPMLETVHIDMEVDRDPDGDEEVRPRRCPVEVALAATVRAFSVCEGLKELHLEERLSEMLSDRTEKFDQVAEACIPLRNRDVHVCVFENKYLG